MTTTQVDLNSPQSRKLFSVVIKPTESPLNKSRLGKLQFPKRKVVETPHYLALTSRGAVPHLSQDMMRDHTSISGVYTALEDYIEKAPFNVPPVFNTATASGGSPLRRFISLQEETLVVLGPRRIPPLPCPASNTDTAISIVTAVGFGTLESPDYLEAVQKLRPDIVLGMGDVAYGSKASQRRLERMGDRTLAWAKELITETADEGSESPAAVFFAPILPIEPTQQEYYLADLENELQEHLSGLVLYEAGSVPAIPATLNHLPRLLIDELDTPHKLLDAISLGIDIFAIPFIYAATDAGIALDFVFPPPVQLNEAKELLPLGIDMWSSSHAVHLAPLRSGCPCFTCTNHHRAYLQHLLGAKEMLGWVLLQLHNHHIMDGFFAGVRLCIHESTLNLNKKLFRETYELELPAKTGQGPRVRGYQFKSEGKGQSRKNPIPYRSLDDAKGNPSDFALPTPCLDSQDLQEHGFGVKST